jgi:hypothetical protein
MRRSVVAVVVAAALTAAGLALAPSAGAHDTGIPARASIAVDGAPVTLPAKGVHNPQRTQAGRTKTANMSFHGGNIIASPTIRAVFWGTSWAGYSGDKMTGIDSFWSGWAGSNYAKASTEYTGANGQVTTAATYGGHVVDTSAASGGGSSSAILAEVAKLVNSGSITLNPNGSSVIPVYTDLPRGSAGYCAWHASGTVGTTPVQFHFYWKLDGDPGCDPSDTSGLHSQGLAALANVSGHEMSETVTDPNTSGVAGTAGWYDSRGAENGDKCAWTFGAPLVTLSNGTQWKVQGEWSNAAYTAGTGYTNSSGQKGCLSGA